MWYKYVSGISKMFNQSSSPPSQPWFWEPLLIISQSYLHTLCVTVPFNSHLQHTDSKSSFSEFSRHQKLRNWMLHKSKYNIFGEPRNHCPTWCTPICWEKTQEIPQASGRGSPCYTWTGAGCFAGSTGRRPARCRAPAFERCGVHAVARRKRLMEHSRSWKEPRWWL